MSSHKQRAIIEEEDQPAILFAFREWKWDQGVKINGGRIQIGKRKSLLMLRPPNSSMRLGLEGRRSSLA